jgi:hypothetical protein
MLMLFALLKHNNYCISGSKQCIFVSLPASSVVLKYKVYCRTTRHIFCHVEGLCMYVYRHRCMNTFKRLFAFVKIQYAFYDVDLLYKT